jgi:23S rRNA (cytidine1920-2'-O)/16S rRNA (cytidine1409-2'-O)-methyltransferase
MRLDQYLVERGEFESRARAQAAIRDGVVIVNGVVAGKPAARISGADIVKVGAGGNPYVSRGGLKLAAALDAFGVDPAGRICLDLGASTGGFSDVLLRRGAAKVYAVDVGVGQLHQRLHGEARLVNLEKTHARDLTVDLVPEAIDLVVCDVSFIGLRKALPPAFALCAAAAEIVALIKPQFELGPEKIGKGGIVRAGENEIEALCDEIRQWFVEAGWRPRGIIGSPIAGGDGNREYLIAATR